MPSWSILGFEVYIPDLTEIINAVVTPLTTFITNSVAGLADTFTPVLDGINATLGGIASSVISTLTVVFNDAAVLITSGIETVGASLSALGPQITGLFASTWTNLSALGQTILTDLGTTINGITLTLGGAIEGLGSTVNAVVDNAAATLSVTFQDAFNIVGATVGGLFSGFGSINISDVLGAHSGVEGLARIATGLLGLHFSPVTPDEAKDWVGPFIDQVTTACGTLHAANLIAEAASLGQIDITLSEAWNYPQTAAAMRVAQEFVSMPLLEGLGPAFKRYILANYQPNIPNYADMIGIYVKEGYLPEKWVELPPEFVQNMTELGYAEFWTQRLWGMHWVLPAVNLLYEMYHRTLGTRPDIGVDLDTLRAMLKYHDYEPRWRDALEAITWRTWRIFDLRTAWEMNILTDDQLVQRSIDTGYSPEEAPLVADTQKMYVLRSEVEKLLTEADNDFIDGFITEDQLRANYDASPFRPDLRDMRVARAKLRRDRDAKKDWAKVLKTYAQKKVLTPEEYGEHLSNLGMVEERVTYEVEDLKSKMTTTAKATTAETKKDLTEARILKIWKVLNLSDKWARERLEGIGYSKEDADLIINSEKGGAE